MPISQNVVFALENFLLYSKFIIDYFSNWAVFDVSWEGWQLEADPHSSIFNRDSL